MKSQEIKLTHDLSCAVEALQMVEDVSARAGLDREQSNVLRLLTEEMISMTTDILKSCRGRLWLECQDGECSLHLNAAAPMEEDAKAAFIAASKEKINTPIKGVKNRISALFAGLLIYQEYPDYYISVCSSFGGGAPMRGAAPMWSLAEYGRRRAGEEKSAELEGVERSILLGFADDVIVSVQGSWVDLTVKKRFSPPAGKQMPNFTGLSHVCIFVDDMMQAVSYYQKLLGAEPDHYLSHWRNKGFFQAGGFLDQAEQGDVSIAFVNVPGTKLTLELMQYHYPEGRKEPVIFAANDVSGARHVALKITNIDEAFQHVKSMPDTKLINQSEAYQVFQISQTQPSEVHFFDQDLRETDQRNVQTARILSQVRYFYFIDKYGLQWEFEQGHSDIGD